MLGSQVVYFVQRDSDGAIKIGYSGDVKRRMGRVQADIGEPVILLATVPGGAAVEGQLHAFFAEHCIGGEWHRPGPDLLAFIAAPQIDDALAAVAQRMTAWHPLRRLRAELRLTQYGFLAWLAHQDPPFILSQSGLAGIESGRRLVGRVSARKVANTCNGRVSFHELMEWAPSAAREAA